MDVLDYGLSFVGGKGAANEVRLWVESRTRVIDHREGAFEDYVQCASCKSEDTFAEADLFYEDNYDFLPIFGPQYGVVFRRTAYLNARYREVRRAEDWFGGQECMLRHPASVRRLTTPADIHEATLSGLPLVAQTELRNDESGLGAIIEYPVKTMNVRRADGRYQVDTGPLALPDLASRDARTVDGLRLAFVAFNTPHFADFVIEVPTSVSGEDGASVQIHHYSERLTAPAENRLYAVEPT